MPRKGARDLAKEQYWRDVINEWRSSKKNAADFCRTHGYKYFLFQDWQKVIRARDAELAVEQRKSVRSQRPATVRKSRQPKPSRTHFVQAKITGPFHAMPNAANEPRVEVVLSCGTVLKITSECTPEFLASLVIALENRAC
jgi:hypothetical protein